MFMQTYLFFELTKRHISAKILRQLKEINSWLLWLCIMLWKSGIIIFISRICKYKQSLSILSNLFEKRLVRFKNTAWMF